MTDRNDDDDPLLVRPYLLGEQGGTVPPASAQTWPEAAAEPVAAPEPADPTVPIRVPGPPARRRRLPRPLLLSAALLVLTLVGAAALVASLLPEPRTPSALPIDIPLPTPVGSAPARAGTAASTVAVPPATAASRTRATSRPPATSAPTPSTAGRSARPAATTASPAVNQLVPPATDRVGRIHGTGGLCLDLNEASAVDGNRVQVYTCNDTSAQGWTVAADGTLRILGKCAVVTGDAAVQIAGCDGGRAGQWRAGPKGTLISVPSGGCLTDPSTGTGSGTGVRVEACSGAEGQRWVLP